MQRKKQVYKIAPGHYDTLKNKMLNWSRQFSILLFLDSNKNISEYARYECLLAGGIAEHIAGEDVLQALANNYAQNKDWLFGHITYEYKDKLEPRLNSRHPTTDGFPVISFFRPQVVCTVDTNCTQLSIECIGIEPGKVYEEINQTNNTLPDRHISLEFAQRTTQEKYLQTIDKLRAHIKQGDCYEINYCTEGFAENVQVEPLSVFNRLNEISKAPFAAYYRNENSYMMCASPERYIRKNESTITAQPIKGTIRRGGTDIEDSKLKDTLRNSIKDRAENVMITDLLRNDLARSCKTGSVRVPELYGIYTFPQVHQMVSTVEGVLSDDKTFADVLRYSFPMGSMTGAPKIKVMELIDEYEDMTRGLFSGTVGYITPEGDFDFNVIIRSLFYNSATRYLSYKAGGAITYDSSPEAEWEEMRLKAWALEKVFS